MTKQGYIAFDLGAESGRAMLITIADGKVNLEEAHRFANLPQRLPSGYHWNLLDLWRNLVDGLGRAAELAKQNNIDIVSLGADTWGLDFGLLGKSGQLLSLPYAYRDERCHDAYAAVVDKLGDRAIYDATGIQFMPMNTLFQLYAQYQAEPSSLESADRLLMMPDLLHYFFCGEKVNEATDASTTQIVNPRGSDVGQWETALLDQLGIPSHFLGDLAPAGTPIGALLPHVREAANCGAIQVIAPGNHDTASAVAAVPAPPDAPGSPTWAYISSGTWSLMGIESDEPIINDETFKLSLTNERGVEGKIRLLKNISGLWLVQECRRDLAKQGDDIDYPTLTKMASEAEPFRTLIDTDHAPFASPGGILEKINAFAASTNQPAPQTPGQYVRCCLESLALTYRRTFTALEQVAGKRIDQLHIVGGGGKNELLDQMTADALNRPAIVGPYEATAIGNALTQAMGAGHIADLAALRDVVRNSFDLKTFEPTGAAAYDEAAARYPTICGN